jgi:hypothetical protein
MPNRPTRSPRQSYSDDCAHLAAAGDDLGDAAAEAPAGTGTGPDLALAEAFIDAFYSFDPDQLAPLLAAADGSRDRILYYQGWAEGGLYRVLDRQPCVAVEPGVYECAITVEDASTCEKVQNLFLLDADRNLLAQQTTWV